MDREDFVPSDVAGTEHAHPRSQSQASSSSRAAPAANSTEVAVLVISDRSRLSKDLESTLIRRGHKTSVATCISEGVERISREAPRLVIVVLPLLDTRAREAVSRIRGVDESLSLVLAGVDRDVPGPAEAFELGAQEYLTLPLEDPTDFLATVGLLLGARRGDVHLRYLQRKEEPQSGWRSVVGESPALQRVIHTFKQLQSRTLTGHAPTILIGGETGTGKGFVAKTFHYNGVRRNRPFVEVNCAAIPPSLIESELFGHERGSFTDAKAGRNGLFETADRGTLFLDEIATIPLDLQAKLLKSIEEKTVRRIGARQSTRVDVQIIAATHEDLSRRVKEGTFREDLYHRLNIVAVIMPPLRDRGSDLVLLAEEFLASLCRQYGMPARKLSPKAKAWLQAYSWPGNVRELRNQIERIVLLENDPVVQPEHFRGSESTARVRVDCSGADDLRVSLPPSGAPLAVIEREILREALSRCGGNVSRAARFLSITRQTLIYRMKKHGLGPEGGEA
jgi:two-component system, NtrC family, response regulator AtoC